MSLSKQRTIQHRPGRSPGRRWILRGGYGVHDRLSGQQSGLLGLSEDLQGKCMPGARRCAAVVIQAPTQLALSPVLLRQCPQSPGNTGCGGWAALLVRHHRKLLPLAPQPQHGFHEVVAVGTKYPTGPQDQMPGTGISQHLLASQLAGPVHTGRTRGVTFPVGR